MAHLRTYQTRTVTWGFGASIVGVDPLEANWVASCSRPCLRFGGVLVHLHVPQILYFILTVSFDFTWIQRPPFDIVLCFLPTHQAVLHPHQPLGYRPRTQDLTALKRVARYTTKYPRTTCRYPWTQLDNNVEVFGDAHCAGCHSTRNSTMGGVAMWSGQLVETLGVLALSSGESELAAVERAATEGMGLQSILNDFCLCGHVAIKSDATAAIGMVHRLGLETCGCSTMLVQGKFDSPKCQDWRIRAMHKPSISGGNHCCATRKRVIGSLSLMMTSRDEFRWVVLRQGVDFVGHQEVDQNTEMHGQMWSRGL